MDIPKDTRCLYYHAEKCQSQKRCNYMRQINGLKLCAKNGDIGKMEIKDKVDRTSMLCYYYARGNKWQE